MGVTNMSFPHPVLGNNDDVSVGSFNPAGTMTIRDEVVTLNLDDLRSQNPAIDALVLSGDAHAVARVQCPTTFFRRSFTTTAGSRTIQLRGVDLEGSVEVDIRICSTAAISSYQPDGMHDDYDGMCFDLDAGETLACTDRQTFLVEKDFEVLRAPLPSIFVIREGKHDIGPFLVTWHTAKITIDLSREDRRNYQAVKNAAPGLLHGLVVLPVLTEAIRKRNDDDCQDERWAQRLTDLIEKNGLDDEHEEPLLVAQKLLQGPTGRALVVFLECTDLEGEA